MSRSHLGNSLLIAALIAIALGFAAWQRDLWWLGSPDRLRLVSSALALGAWVAFSVVMLRPPRRRSPDDIRDTDAQSTLLILWASQTGFARELAEFTAASLSEADIASRIRPIETASPAMLRAYRHVVFIASTSGEGDAPDHALGFLSTLAGHALGDVSYAVLALGDSDYSHFCGFGRQLDHTLGSAGAQPLFDRIDVDRADPAALRHWQQQLAHSLGIAAMQDWVPAHYQAWALRARQHLNPGSIGAPVHRLWLDAAEGADAVWQAGDIAEIGPHHATETVAAWLDETGFNGDSLIASGNASAQRLADWLATMQLPAARDMAGLNAAELLDTLRPLPHREYSIASLADEGSLQLLVREMRDDSGRLGLGSGWLCQHAAIGSRIDLRIRRNPSFHAPAADTPLILIGNGTGIAGLRTHLAARVASDARRNWLIFGERQAAHDAHFADDLAAWQAQGFLPQFDAVYSRDGGPHRYVQDRLQAEAHRLRQWVDEGAAIYVCGSLHGMAPAVDAAIGTILGTACRDALRAAGRYRRDVY
ncbi:MAG: sulfite reductase subunit alpha [Pseudomonadota bacterium]|nr:sulfite reductase subunit alpha [Pseudomonadota bacterium]